MTVREERDALIFALRVALDRANVLLAEVIAQELGYVVYHVDGRYIPVSASKSFEKKADALFSLLMNELDAELPYEQ